MLIEYFTGIRLDRTNIKYYVDFQTVIKALFAVQSVNKRFATGRKI